MLRLEKNRPIPMRILFVTEGQYAALQDLCAPSAIGKTYKEFLEQQDAYRIHLVEIGIHTKTVTIDVPSLKEWRSRRTTSRSKALTRNDLLLFASLVDEATPAMDHPKHKDL